MNYQEEYQKAQEKGKLQRLTKNIWTWDEEGQELSGKCLEIAPFTEGQFDTEVNSYSIETDRGIITTVLGSATDKQLAKIDPVGMFIHIVFHGKKVLPDGRSVNQFDVDVW